MSRKVWASLTFVDRSNVWDTLTFYLIPKEFLPKWRRLVPVFNSETDWFRLQSIAFYKKNAAAYFFPAFSMTWDNDGITDSEGIIERKNADRITDLQWRNDDTGTSHDARGRHWPCPCAHGNLRQLGPSVSTSYIYSISTFNKTADWYKSNCNIVQLIWLVQWHLNMRGLSIERNAYTTYFNIVCTTSTSRAHYLSIVHISVSQNHAMSRKISLVLECWMHFLENSY